MNRNIALDTLKFLLAFMVVSIHTGFLNDLNQPTIYYLTSEGLFRIAVPLFLLINGYYFYDVLNNEKLDAYMNLHFIYRNFLFFAFPFFFIGFLINKYNTKEKMSMKFLTILVSLGIVFLVCESYLNYISPSRDGGFDMYFSLLIICPFIFILISKLDFRGNSKILSYYASGIYFIHFLFLNIFHHNTEYRGTILTLIVFSTSIIAVTLLINLNKKFKYVL